MKTEKELKFDADVRSKIRAWDVNYPVYFKPEINNNLYVEKRSGNLKCRYTLFGSFIVSGVAYTETFNSLQAFLTAAWDGLVDSDMVNDYADWCGFSRLNNEKK